MKITVRALVSILQAVELGQLVGVLILQVEAVRLPVVVLHPHPQAVVHLGEGMAEEDTENIFSDFISLKVLEYVLF